MFVYPVWNLFSFLNLQVGVFRQLWETSSHYIFAYLSLWDSDDVNVRTSVIVPLVHMVLLYVLNFFAATFSFFICRKYVCNYLSKYVFMMAALKSVSYNSNISVISVLLSVIGVCFFNSNCGFPCS